MVRSLERTLPYWRLAELAAACGFRQEEEFESDVEGGRLGWYQVWGKK
jgi:hypothetical protein